jgi:Uma2 family endonuclease
MGRGAAVVRSGWTFEEVEALEARTGERYELVDGAIYAMSGGSLDHGRLCMGLAGQMDAQPMSGPAAGQCEPLPSDNKVRVRDPADKSYRYPDLSVFCGDPELHEGTETLLTNPTLLFEVTSPTSGERDTVVKLGEYTAIPSLRAYVVIEQTRREVTVHERTGDGGWTKTTYLGDTLSLPGVPAQLDVDALYARIQL